MLPEWRPNEIMVVSLFTVLQPVCTSEVVENF
jgi:hypothetical protein